MDPPELYTMWMSAFDNERRARLLEPDFLAEVGGPVAQDVLTTAWRSAKANDKIDQMLATDVETYLPADLLVKMDIATMAYSVEARSPFLDHHVMEFAASLPTSQKLRGMTGKRLLKTAMRGVVPDAILDRPKMGFGVPLERWFREELRELPSEILLDPRARPVIGHRGNRADAIRSRYADLARCCDVGDFRRRQMAQVPHQRARRRR